MKRRKGSSKPANNPQRGGDWTMGTLPDDSDLLLRDLRTAAQCTQTITNLCHDLMDMSSWSRKDPMAYLAECYRINAIAYYSLRRVLETIAKQRAESPAGRIETVARLLEDK